MISLCGKNIKQISAGRNHSAAWTSDPIDDRAQMLGIPDRVPAQYDLLADVTVAEARGRLRVLRKFSDLVGQSWPLVDLTPHKVDF